MLGAVIGAGAPWTPEVVEGHLYTGRYLSPQQLALSADLQQAFPETRVVDIEATPRSALFAAWVDIQAGEPHSLA